MTGALTTVQTEDVPETLGYNGYGELTSIRYDGLASGHGYAASYQRDASGRVEVKTETIEGTEQYREYRYDAAGRIWQVFETAGATVPAREYTYDDNGNRVGGVYDDKDRLRMWGSGTSFEYGANGELASRTVGGVGGVTTTYVYDGLGNLRTVTGGGLDIEYVIDGLNRRVGKKVGGTLHRAWLYDGSRIIAELDGTGAIASELVYGSGRHTPDFMIVGTERFRLISDQLGSVRMVVNVTPGASQGTVVQRFDYDEWGQLANAPAAFAGRQPIGFAGGQNDADTGFVRFGARDYDPSVGRWTSQDASLFEGGLNFYAYSRNDPSNYLDQDGKNPVLAAAIVGFATGFVGSVIAQKITTGTVDYGDAAASGAFGAIGGGLGAAVRAGMLVSAAIGAVANLAQSQTTATLHNKPLTTKSATASFVIGGAAGAVASLTCPQYSEGLKFVERTAIKTGMNAAVARSLNDEATVAATYSAVNVAGNGVASVVTSMPTDQ